MPTSTNRRASRHAVNGSVVEKGSRTITVVPTNNEADLFYYDWVEGNLARVSKATGGRVGYLHVPDMQQTGLNEFAKYVYRRHAGPDHRGNRRSGQR